MVFLIVFLHNLPIKQDVIISSSTVFKSNAVPCTTSSNMTRITGIILLHFKTVKRQGGIAKQVRNGYMFGLGMAGLSSGILELTGGMIGIPTPGGYIDWAI